MKSRMALPLLIVSTLMAQTPASLSDSPFASGNSFLHFCSVMDRENYDTAEMASVNACLGYIYGFVDGTTVQLVMGDHGKAIPNASFCVDTIPTQQLGRVVLKYVRDHPEEASKPTGILVFKAFKNAFPCK